MMHPCAGRVYGTGHGAPCPYGWRTGTFADVQDGCSKTEPTREYMLFVINALTAGLGKIFERAKRAKGF